MTEKRSTRDDPGRHAEEPRPAGATPPGESEQASVDVRRRALRRLAADAAPDDGDGRPEGVSRAVGRAPHAPRRARRAVPARLRALQVLGLLAGGLAPAGALGAGSVAYLKDGNVWVTNLDGSITRQITTDSPAADLWAAPGQSDTGVIVANRATKDAGGNTNYYFHYFDLAGNRIDGPFLESGNGNLGATGPVEARLSPDGSQVAFTYAANGIRLDIDNRSPMGGGSLFPEYPGYREPAWFGRSGQVVAVDAATNSGLHWQEPSGMTGWRDLGGGFVDNLDFTRDGDRMLLAWRADPLSGPTNLFLFTVSGAPPAGVPTLRCQVPDARDFKEARFTADGADIVWQDAAGIWTSPAPAPPSCAIAPRLLVAGGRLPSPGAVALSPLAPAGPSATPGTPQGSQAAEGSQTSRGPQTSQEPQGPRTPGGPCPPANPELSCVKDATRPAATGFAVSVGRRGLVSVAFRLSEGATASGRLLRRGARGRLLNVRTLTPRALRAGRVRLPLGAPAPGRYRLVLRLTDAAGNLTTLDRALQVTRRVAVRRVPRR